MIKTKNAQSFLFVIGCCTVSSFAFLQVNCDLESIVAITPKGAVVDTVTAVASPVAHCEIVGHTIT